MAASMNLTRKADDNQRCEDESSKNFQESRHEQNTQGIVADNTNKLTDICANAQEEVLDTSNVQIDDEESNHDDDARSNSDFLELSSSSDETSVQDSFCSESLPNDGNEEIAGDTSSHGIGFSDDQAVDYSSAFPSNKLETVANSSILQESAFVSQFISNSPRKYNFSDFDGGDYLSNFKDEATQNYSCSSKLNEINCTDNQSLENLRKIHSTAGLSENLHNTSDQLAAQCIITKSNFSACAKSVEACLQEFPSGSTSVRSLHFQTMRKPKMPTFSLRKKIRNFCQVEEIDIERKTQSLPAFGFLNSPVEGDRVRSVSPNCTISYWQELLTDKVNPNSSTTCNLQNANFKFGCSSSSTSDPGMGKFNKSKLHCNSQNICINHSSNGFKKMFPNKGNDVNEDNVNLTAVSKKRVSDKNLELKDSNSNFSDNSEGSKSLCNLQKLKRNFKRKIVSSSESSDEESSVLPSVISTTVNNLKTPLSDDVCTQKSIARSSNISTATICNKIKRDTSPLRGVVSMSFETSINRSSPTIVSAPQILFSLDTEESEVEMSKKGSCKSNEKVKKIRYDIVDPEHVEISDDELSVRNNDNADLKSDTDCKALSSLSTLNGSGNVYNTECLYMASSSQSDCDEVVEEADQTVLSTTTAQSNTSNLIPVLVNESESNVPSNVAPNELVSESINSCDSLLDIEHADDSLHCTNNSTKEGNSSQEDKSTQVDAAGTSGTRKQKLLHTSPARYDSRVSAAQLFSSPELRSPVTASLRRRKSLAASNRLSRLSDDPVVISDDSDSENDIDQRRKNRKRKKHIYKPRHKNLADIVDLTNDVESNESDVEVLQHDKPVEYLKTEHRRKRSRSEVSISDCAVVAQTIDISTTEPSSVVNPQASIDFNDPNLLFGNLLHLHPSAMPTIGEPDSTAESEAGPSYTVTGSSCQPLAESGSALGSTSSLSVNSGPALLDAVCRESRLPSAAGATEGSGTFKEKAMKMESLFKYLNVPAEDLPIVRLRQNIVDNEIPPDLHETLDCEVKEPLNVSTVCSTLGSLYSRTRVMSSQADSVTSTPVYAPGMSINLRRSHSASSAFQDATPSCSSRLPSNNLVIPRSTSSELNSNLSQPYKFLAPAHAMSVPPSDQYSAGPSSGILPLDLTKSVGQNTGDNNRFGGIQKVHLIRKSTKIWELGRTDSNQTPEALSIYPVFPRPENVSRPLDVVPEVPNMTVTAVSRGFSVPRSEYANLRTPTMSILGSATTTNHRYGEDPGHTERVSNEVSAMTGRQNSRTLTIHESDNLAFKSGSTSDNRRERNLVTPGPSGLSMRPGSAGSSNSNDVLMFNDQSEESSDAEIAWQAYKAFHLMPQSSALPQQPAGRVTQSTSREPAASADSEESVEISCPICFDSLSEIKASGKHLVSTVCGHLFCDKCLEPAIRRTKQCPNCRRRLTKKQFHKVYL